MSFLDKIKEIWTRFSLFKKIISISFLFIVLLIILAYLEIIRPVYILWGILVIIILGLMIKGKKGVKL